MYAYRRNLPKIEGPTAQQNYLPALSGSAESRRGQTSKHISESGRWQVFWPEVSSRSKTYDDYTYSLIGAKSIGPMPSANQSDIRSLGETESLTCKNIQSQSQESSHSTHIEVIHNPTQSRRVDRRSDVDGKRIYTTHISQCPGYQETWKQEYQIWKDT